MGSIETIANNGFDFAQGLIDAGLSAFQGFFEAATGSLSGE